MRGSSQDVVDGTDPLCPPLSSAFMQSELANHVAWSLRAPHGLRTNTDDVDAALRRNRLEVLRTVAAMRASEEEFGGAKPSRAAALVPRDVRLPNCGARKALYPRRTTGRYKTMEDLASGAASRRASRAALPVNTREEAPAGEAVAEVTVRDDDPRLAVAEKHRAAVEIVRPHIPVQIERSLQAHQRCLGAVKPYGLAQAAKRPSRQVAVHPYVDINEHYVDRMQCCRPSKGLYVYYE